MTLKSFLEELSQLKDKKGFVAEFYGQKIRLSRGDDKCYCPLVAVCFFKTQICFANSQHQEAGRKLGLKSLAIRRILYAADYHHWDKAARRLRIKMLRILGLQDRKTA